MATLSIAYGTRTALANVTRIHSDANNYATAFGEVDNSTALAMDYQIHLIVPISSSATTGTYDLYMVESQDGAEWTDNIDPATDADYADFVKDAIWIKSAPTVYDNSPTGARTEAEFHFNVGDYVRYPAKYFGFVLVNKSGQSVPASGADGDSVAINLTSA